MADTIETKEERVERIKQELFEMTCVQDITPEMRDEYKKKQALLDSLLAE